ncbi:MAG TPA: 50S ribosomal protein L15 [Candidatus Saccharimonadales bacterium]|jgi:large subunit ribosomal protein L15|nr:50S ribosomal protein L15 [Candidatus Saccharimonadales bacterium]
MKIHELQTEKRKAAKRVGRGIAAGQGKTAGRGTKGQKSRTGSSAKPGFEGGQTPLMIRLPKLPGFRSFKTPAEAVYTKDLDALAGKTIDTEAMAKAGLISNPFVKVKVITKGEVTKKVTIQAQGISASALAAVQKAGGSFEKVKTIARPTAPAKTEKLAAIKQNREEKKATKMAAKTKKKA